MATHSSVLAWRLPRTEEFGLLSMVSQRAGHTEPTHASTRVHTHTHTHTHKGYGKHAAEFLQSLESGALKKKKRLDLLI